MATSWEALLDPARASFAAEFRAEADTWARAPGRVELLGNHTDYNGGLVLAAAIDRSTVVVGRKVEAVEATIVSVHFRQTNSFSLESIEPVPESWAGYVRGVCWALQAHYGPLVSGFQAAIHGDVPLGAGLSSSASLQAALARFLIQLGVVPGCRATDFDGPCGDAPELRHAERACYEYAADFDGPCGDAQRMDLARVLRRSENEFVGVGSGLLDQFSSLFGRAGHALFLDCRSLEYDRVPLGAVAPAIVVCDSRTSRRLADGMYDRRRAECERVMAFFRDSKSHRSEFMLSEVTIEELEREWTNLDPVGRKRARHVLLENERVRHGARALKAGDLATFGRLMSASHVSSRDDFENSAAALDLLIESAEGAPGFLGGKLSGAGWAGCTVNLVEAAQADEFADHVRSAFAGRTGTECEIHVCHAADGATGDCVSLPR
jgi:galactokinase